MLDIKQFLKYVDISDLHDKICKFRDLDFKKLDYQGVQNAISKTIIFPTPQGATSVLRPGLGNYPKGTRFFRVRTIPTDDHLLPLLSMRSVADCWEPPSKIVKIGRLNRENESLLYTAPMDPVVAIEELKIGDGQLFSLIVYEAIEQINITIIGGQPNVGDFSKEEQLKLRMIQDFLKHEFIRDVGAGTEYLYRISESIAKDYFDLPPEFHDGWCYPSVAKKGGCNVCFRKSGHIKLKLVGVQLATVYRQPENYLFQIKLIAKDSGDGDNLSYHEIGSNVQHELFPEITSS